MIFSRPLSGRVAMLAATVAASMLLSMAPARAGNTVLWSPPVGDLTFPFTAPMSSTNTPGTIDNMIIGGTTPLAGNFTSITGPSAATAPSLIVLGGSSSTSASQGGSARLHGGIGGATGIGGDATIRGGIGGSTSGAGGLASVTGGAGTAGNSAGGLARAVGGAGQGSAAGGAALLTGGVGGATGAGGAATITAGAGGATSGAGGIASLNGGAGSAGNANGGDVNIAGGAANGSGVNGVVRETGVRIVGQGAPGSQDTAATLTAAQILAGILTSNPSGAVNLQLPLATAMDTALPTSAAGDSFDFSVISIAGSTNLPTLTTNTGWTLVGAVTFTSVAGNAGRFRARKTGTGAWTLYRLS